MLRTIHSSILNWYQHNGRHDLPWRQTNDAYKIYLSEIMLQQTQVKTVLERFYFPFLERFPSLKSVAKAPLDDVLKAWEGLGYYTRAKNLHHTAQTCQTTLPASPEELGGLKGIGKSTAHAICAFAYKHALPILDANVKRVLCRFYALESKDEKVLWQKAWELLDREHPFEYNQAMMDIGSLVCMPKEPRCASCPLEAKCLGKESPLAYPKAIKKAKVPLRQRFALVIEKEGKIALLQRKEKLLHGLWGFAQVDEVPFGEYLGEVTHTYSHFKLILKVYSSHREVKDAIFFEPETLKSLALSRVDQKILALPSLMMRIPATSQK